MNKILCLVYPAILLLMAQQSFYSLYVHSNSFCNDSTYGLAVRFIASIELVCAIAMISAEVMIALWYAMTSRVPQWAVGHTTLGGKSVNKM